VAQISLGTLAVIGFFAISRFLVRPGIMHGGFVRYLFMRCARILGTFLCLNVITIPFLQRFGRDGLGIQGIFQYQISALICFIILFLTTSPASPHAGWSMLKGLPVDVPRRGIVNESIWTLPLEFICYIALGIFVITLTRFFSRRFEQLFLSVLFISWLVTIYFSTVMPNFWEPNPTLFTTVFGK
jgi:peptidoglycan/LPS O-acetylase OafA/YrhL